MSAGMIQMEPTENCQVATELLKLGYGPEACEKALRYLGSDEPSPEELAVRIQNLADLARSCGSLQNAKLAYSLATRSGLTLNDTSVALLSSSLGCSDCVPAGVRLWKTALELGVEDEESLTAATRLGEDGAGQIRVLNLLRQNPEQIALVGELARRLDAPGWEAEGSWGAIHEPSKGLVWWDFASPRERRSYGMSLTSDSIDLKNLLGVRLHFEARHQILGTTDRCHLEISTDGKRWEKLVKFEGCREWEDFEVDLSRFRDERILLRFHVLSGGQREGRGMEISAPKLTGWRVTGHQRIALNLQEGWEEVGQPGVVTRNLFCSHSETELITEPVKVEGTLAPTLSFEAKMASSSVYAEARIELLDSEGDVVQSLQLDGTADWHKQSLEFPAELRETRVRLWARFAQRREYDGFSVRRLCVKSGTSQSKTELQLDGGYDDGAAERKAVVALLEAGQIDQLKLVSGLREGLPNLASALAMSTLVEEEDQIPALLVLFANLKEEAVHAFSTLKALATDEDLLLQSQVLLESGLEHYASTRDHLGDGLVSVDEFEEHARLYLQLRETWTEEQTRQGLSLLLTPIADESAADRLAQFRSLLETHPEAEEFLAAWGR